MESAAPMRALVITRHSLRSAGANLREASHVGSAASRNAFSLTASCRLEHPSQCDPETMSTQLSRLPHSENELVR